VDVLQRRFAEHEDECAHLIARRLPLPAYDQVLKCSNIFNTLDSRGAISVTERVGVIARIRKLAVGVAAAWVEQRQ
jgi:glycyl-tRNA synthetase alpha chain